MNLKEIKEIINLMNENDLSEIEVEREGGKIKIKRSSQYEMGAVIQRSSSTIENLPPVLKPGDSSQQPSSAGKTVAEIVSPMVGTFYRSPSPEAPPFVEIGQVIEVGQVVCIVEAMKLMNEIKSEVRGKVIRFAVENTEPVEFGQTLFEIEPM